MEIEAENTFLLISFSLGDTWYGLEASQVQEVIPVENSTYVYQAPAYVHGIINLRGKIVTVIDLRMKIGLKAGAQEEDETGSGDERVLVVSWNQEQVGILVDSVAEVISIDPEQIEAALSNITERLRYFLTGVYQSEDVLIGILDLEKVLAVDSNAS